MKWVTRERVKVDRVACPWLIRNFIDPEAEFLFVPEDKVMEVAKSESAIPYDVNGVVDADLERYDTLWAAAGTPNAVFRLTPADLARLTGGKFATVAKPPGGHEHDESGAELSLACPVQPR